MKKKWLKTKECSMVKKNKETINKKWFPQKDMKKEWKKEKLVEKKTYKKKSEIICANLRINYQKSKEI